MTPEAVWEEWRQFSKGSKYDFSGITYPRLRKERGLQWPCPTEDHPGTKRRFVGGEDPLVTPGKQIEFYGKPDKKAVVYLRPYIPAPEQPSEHYPLLLTIGRVLEQWHSGTITDKVKELSQASGRAKFDINLQDAHHYGISSGEKIRVVSAYGALSMEAVVTDSPKVGSSSPPFFIPKNSSTSSSPRIMIRFRNNRNSRSRQFALRRELPEHGLCHGGQNHRHSGHPRGKGPLPRHQADGLLFPALQTYCAACLSDCADFGGWRRELPCLRGIAKFESIKSHHTLRKRLEENQTNCTHCHGFPHPTPAERPSVHLKTALIAKGLK